MATTTEAGYSFAATAHILDVTESRLRYWAQIGFVGPSQRREGKAVFTFADLVAVKAARELVDRGFAPAEVRKALAAVSAALPEVGRPLDRLRVTWDGQALVIVDDGVDDGAAFETTGQRVFDFGLGDLHRRASSVGDLPAAVAKASKVVPTRAAYEWLGEGLRLEQAGVSGDEAAACYRRAITADPGLAAAHTNLGILEHRRGDAVSARRCFEAALALDPEQPEARFNLATLIYEAGDAELAAAELRRVLQLDPGFADAHYNLATAIEGLGGRQQAREHLLRYIELAVPGAPEAEVWTAEASARIARLA